MEFVGGGGRGDGRGIRGDCAGEPPVEQQGAGEEVGGVEAVDGEGDDVVEGDGGADVDEGEEAGDDYCDEDGGEGDGGAGFDLRGFVSTGCSWEVGGVGLGNVRGED